MKVGSCLRLLGIILLLLGTQVVGATDSTIGDTSASSHEIQFCSGLTTPYVGCPAADLRLKADKLAAPVAIYEYLRNNYDFTLYHGARSGAVNTFGGGRGNDVDLAATLIAMLRSQNVPARYVVGTVRIHSAQVINWLAAKNLNLAYHLLRDVGIQGVAQTLGGTTLDMEHVWVEALVPYDDYRGAGNSGVNCVSTPSACNWVPLDPSFKQRQTQSSGLDPYSSLTFDYDSYYKAIQNSDGTRKDKNPLEVYQNQALNWLQANAPGKTLDDIPDYTNLVVEQNGLLPASLPYALVGGVRRYNSVKDHDDAVTAGTEPKNWNKYVTVQVQIGSPTPATVPGGATVSLVDAASQRLTFGWDPLASGYAGTFRLAGVATGATVNADGAASVNGTSMILGGAVKVLLTMDGAPALGAGSTDTPITATYNGVIGGYYQVATGGETSNWGQVHRAAQQLLAANQQYPIVYNAGEAGCDVTSGQGCTPYVDANNSGWDASDAKLIDSKPAMDALTGGLLEVAAHQYFTKSREKIAQLDAINRIRTPIVGFVGMVSSTHAVEYLDGTAFSVQPGGLLIDMKGMTIGGSWRIDQPDQSQAFSGSQFELAGHILSSLEHETWQELTGFDAISTVRGIQIALANSASLVTPYRNAGGDTLAATYPSFGFSTSVPAGFTPHTYNLFGQNYQSWSYSGSDPSAGFEALLANSQGIPTGDYRLKEYVYSASNGVDAFYNNYANLIQQVNSWQSTVGQLKSGIQYDHKLSNYVGRDIVGSALTSDTPAGFALGSVTRTASDTYRYVLNETAQHSDGTYTVKVRLNMANASNSATNSFNLTTPTNVSSVAVASSYAGFSTDTGFSVVSFSQTSTSQLTVTLVPTVAHADSSGYLVALRVSGSFSGGTGYYPIALLVTVAGGRVVDPSIAMTVGFYLDTSDNHSLSCQGGANGTSVQYTGAPSQLMSNLQGCFNNVLAVNNLTDQANFFTPSASLIYRPTPLAADDRPAKSVADIRDTLDQADTSLSWYAYRSPSKLSTGPNFSFAVDYRKQTDAVTGRTSSASYLISNQQVGAAGGGFVTAMEPLLPAVSIDPISYSQPTTVVVQPTFVNSFFTDLNNVAATNNSLVCTPSTIDPVSTVTGNNYHDETDFVIKGRAGLNYAFTRTYNSTPSATKNDLGLGNGWSHSYGMQLKSNDYGKCPNCTSAQSAENGNGKTSSITYTDERGGDHNYLITEDSGHTVTPPQGEFEGLALDSPAAGQNTLTFRNGTRYVFENVSADGTTLAPGTTLKTTPGIKSRLKQIVDLWGNQLNYTYNAAGRLATVTDNLGIAGRTGLVFTYDANNRLLSIADWSGRSWKYSVVNAGGSPVSYHLASYTDPLNQTISYGYAAGTSNLITIAKPLRGVQTTFSYYQNGRTFNYHDALGNTETLDYDLFRKSTRVTDPRGGVREYQYDSNGGMTRLTEPDGAILLFDNDATTGMRYTKTDGLGYKTQYSYKVDKTFNSGSDTFGNVTREQDALGQTVDTTYGPYDQVATVKDKRGTVLTTSFYTGSGTCIAAGKPNTVIISTLNGVANVKLKRYCWNADGTLASQTDYLSPTDLNKTRITTVTYDTAAHLNVQSVTVAGSDGTSVTKTYTYDNLGRQKSETLLRRTSPDDTAQLALTTTKTYDALDRPIQIVDPAGNIALNSYDANGQLWQVTHQYKKAGDGYDTRNIVTRTFDAADRVQTETDALGGVTRYGYDPAGNVISTTDPEGHTVHIDYDEMGRRAGVTDANGRNVRTTYDQAGHPVSVTNGANETTTTAYDKIGRPVSVIDPHGYISTLAYDPNNNPTCAIDANAQVTPSLRNIDNCSASTTYDELNRPTLTRDALNGTTQTTYDLLGNPLSRIDAEGRKYTWAYDGLGRLISETDFAGLTTTYSLDEAGNPWQKTNRLGEFTQSTFDALNRPTYITYLKDGSSETLTYDPAGNLASVANANVGYTFGYDTLNRLLSKRDSRGRSLAFSWDKSGHILTKTTYQSSTTNYTYDGAGTLVSLSNPDYLSVDYQYDGAGRLISRNMSSGVRSLYTYDTGGWLNSLTHTDAVGSNVTSQSYTRDRVGNVTATNVSSGPITGSTNYTLDALYRLTTVDAPGTANDEAFSYDHLGNRLTATRGGTTIGAVGSTTKFSIYNPATQTGNPGYAATYNNRLKEIRIGSLSGTIDGAFTFDNEGRLSSQTGSTPRSLIWDAKGRLKTLTQGGKTETYRYDPSNHRIGRSGGTLGNLNYYLEGEHLESVELGGRLQEKYFRGSTIDELVAGYFSQSGNLTPFFYQNDQVMSVAAQTKPNGGTQATLAYFAFGEAQATTGTPVGRLQYTGRENDGNGCYYYRARYYCPGIGFISEDPLKFGAGANFYAYANNNPVNENDPSGLCGPKCLGAIWGAIAGGVGGAISGYQSDGVSGALIGAGVGASIGAGVGTINPFLSLRLGSSAAASAVSGGVASTAGQLATNVALDKPLGTDFSYFSVAGAVLGGPAALIPARLAGTFAGEAAGVSIPFGSSGSLTIVTPSVVASAGVAKSVVEGVYGGIFEGGADTIGKTYFYPNQPNTNQMQSVYRKP